MEREELKAKVDEVLGSTQLTLSERTINEELDDALEGVTDDATIDDAFVSRLAKRFKRMDGNLHKDVGEQNRLYKEQFEKDWNEKHPKGSKDGGTNDGEGDEPAWFKAYREQQDAKFQKLEDERKEKEAKVQKENVLKQVKDGVSALFKKADVEPNEWVLRQTMRDVEISEETDVDTTIKKVEKAYYKNLKEAGFADGNQPFGKPQQFGGKKATDSLWEKKKAKEGWGNK